MHDDVPHIPGYEITALLGRGGMGVNDKSALYHDRLRREMNIAKGFSHPYLVKILDGGVIVAT